MKMKPEPVIALQKKRLQMTSSSRSHDFCVIYRPETVFRKSRGKADDLIGQFD